MIENVIEIETAKASPTDPVAVEADRRNAKGVEDIDDGKLVAAFDPDGSLVDGIVESFCTLGAVVRQCDPSTPNENGTVFFADWTRVLAYGAEAVEMMAGGEPKTTDRDAPWRKVRPGCTWVLARCPVHLEWVKALVVSATP